MMARNAALHQTLRARARELRQEMTPAEAMLWRHLRAHRFHGLHFRRQEIIDHFIVDFCCLPASLIIEIDGPIHDEQVEQDADRDRILAAHGFRILRFSNEQIMTNIQHCLTRIRDTALPK
jgi:very-short-patch-repair endonuclease